MKLIYRGHTYEYTPPTSQPHYVPRAVNWRYRNADVNYEARPVEIPQYRAPRVINWRYQMAIES